MKVVLDTTHLGAVGGGENYLMRLAMALDSVCDFSVTHNWPQEFEEYNGFYRRFNEFDGLSDPDVYIYCSHFVPISAVGKRNYIVSFFPKRTLIPNCSIDGVIAICGYTAKYVREFWNLDSTIIQPCIDGKSYVSGVKTKKIVSIGHFFLESDGHSKNQHILVEAARDPRLRDYELVLIGNANRGDEQYVRKIRESAQGINCRIEVNRNGAFVRRELETASTLWHANGYGRTDPAQTEHFGIIVLEALASGVVPIVHASGGASQIAGAISWRKPEELVGLTLQNQKAARLQPQYTVKHFNKSVEKWIRNIEHGEG